jgi:hypothetical protein
VSNGVAVGIPGLETRRGDHLCGLYAGDRERDELLIPFLREGLRAGDKCICVVDAVEPAYVQQALGYDLDVGTAAKGKQLDVIRAADLYLRSGSFSASEIIGSWKAAISDVMYDGRFDMVRAVETWSARDVVPDAQELLALESEMNRYLPLYPQVVVCLYDVQRFGGGLIVDLLKSHPRVVMSGMVLENPYYLSPDDLLAVGRGEQDDTGQQDRQEAAEWCYAATTGST